MRSAVILGVGLAAASGCGEQQPATGSSAAGASASTSTSSAAPCRVPDDGLVTKSLTLPKGCALEVGKLVVSSGATLTLEPGVKLTFATDGLLQVDDGHLVAKGTSRDPVLLTGAEKAAGSWVGVSVGGRAKDGNVLENVIIEYAGKQTPVTHAAFTAYELDEPRISVTNSTFRSNAGAGLRGGNAWTKVEGNSFLNNDGASIQTSAVGLTTIGKNKIAEPIFVDAGTMEKSGTWRATGAPIVVQGALRVGKEGAPVVLTIETGAVVRVKDDALYFSHGSLVAKGVIFTGANTPPAEGDWRGLVFEGKSDGSSLDGCTVEFAGKENAIGPGAGVILYEAPELGKEVKVVHTTFKRNKFGGIRGKGCASAEAADNKSEGTPLCAPE